MPAEVGTARHGEVRHAAAARVRWDAPTGRCPWRRRPVVAVRSSLVPRPVPAGGPVGPPDGSLGGTARVVDRTGGVVPLAVPMPPGAAAQAVDRVVVVGVAPSAAAGRVAAPGVAGPDPHRACPDVVALTAPEVQRPAGAERSASAASVVEPAGAEAEAPGPRVSRVETVELVPPARRPNAGRASERAPSPDPRNPQPACPARSCPAGRCPRRTPVADPVARRRCRAGHPTISYPDSAGDHADASLAAAQARCWEVCQPRCDRLRHSRR
jgi:hypothetical protein